MWHCYCVIDFCTNMYYSFSNWTLNCKDMQTVNIIDLPIPLILYYVQLFSFFQDCQQRHPLRDMWQLVHTVSCDPAQLSQSALLGSTRFLWKVPWWRPTLSLKLGLWFPQGEEFQLVNFGQETQQGLSGLSLMKRP